MRLFPHGIVAVDLETTGLSALVDRIIEIAAVKITPDGEEGIFHQLVNPMVELTPENSAIHGLTTDDLKDALTLKRPLRALYGFIGRCPILAHNALFDVAFLVKGSHDFMVDLPPTRAYDSCRFARGHTKVLAPANVPANYRLGTLAAFHGVALHHHVALEDAFASLKITAALLAQTPDDKLNDLRDRAFTISFTQFTRDAAFIMPAKFEPMRPLIRAQSPIEIQYTGGTQGGEWRPVRPIALLPMPKGPVLYAECLAENTNKSFVLRRIQAFRPRAEASLLTQPVGADHVELDFVEGE